MMLQEGVLTTKQSKEIDQPEHPDDRCQLLLNQLLEGEHPKAFVVFRNSLLKEYEWLVKEIDAVHITRGS